MSAGATGRRVDVRARAKLNLFLEVLGKREDGYHEIETVLQEIDLADEISLETLPAIEGGRRIDIAVEGDPAVPPGPGNTVHAAASLFLERFAPAASVRIYMKKKIPSGAGLGGGSSDAAATLRGLAALLGVAAPEGDLAAIAARVGSDVPFFLAGGLAVARGRGERVEPLPPAASPLSCVVVAPPFSCSTAAVYGAAANFLTLPSRSPTILLESLRRGTWKEIGKVLFNRLEGPASFVEPRLRALRDELRSLAAPCPVLMTGSGSALFAVTGGDAESSALEAKLARSRSFLERGCRIFIARGVSGEVR